MSPQLSLASDRHTPWGVAAPLGELLPGTTVTRLAEGPGGPVPGPAEIDAALAEAAGRPLVIVVRYAERHRWLADAVARLLAARPDAIVVEMGLPGRTDLGAAHIATHGSARVCGQAAAEVLAGVADHPDRPGVGPAECAQQQGGDDGVTALPVGAGQVDVAGVEQRHQGRDGRAAGAYRPDAQRTRGFAPHHRGRLPVGPLRPGCSGGLAGRRRGRPLGEVGELGGVPGGQLGDAPVAFRTDPRRHPGGGLAGPVQPGQGGVPLRPGRGQTRPRGPQGVRQHVADPGGELGPVVRHGCPGGHGR